MSYTSYTDKKRLDMRQTVSENPLLAILRNMPDESLIPAVSAIVAGGVRFFEVALNSHGALRQIKALREHFGDSILIGAGTAITVERASSAIEAGAEFLLAPSADEDVLAFCEREGIAMLPGALTPSDVSLCVRHGFNTIKLFPAGDMPYGYVKSLKGPFDDTEYVAIGGVSESNIGEFFRHGYIGVGLGSSMVPRECLESGDFTAATEYTARLTEKIKSIKGEMKK